MGGWAGFFDGSETRGEHTRAVELASRLYPHRATLCSVGLGIFLIASFPLVAVAKGWTLFVPWHAMAFTASVPIVLWALALALHATFFEPTRGLIESLCHARVRTRPWRRRALRGYAALTVAAFAVSPFVVLLAAAVA